MRTSHRLVAVALVLADLSGFAKIAAAADTGSMPYAALYEAVQSALVTQKFDHLLAKATVQSKLVGVSPATIRLRIHARSGIRDIEVAADGSFRFPIEDSLLAENPTISSNQPKGSLTLEVTLLLRPFLSLRVPYREIVNGLAQAGQVLAEDQNQRALVVRGIEVRFAAGRSATVTLRARSEQLLMADADGTVIVRDAAEWHVAGAELEFSEPPLLLLPYLGKPGESP